tara:strand:+ start:875 stop:1267 length:393 start_codon:yes stop_codon:yes gene_type:complete
MKKEKIIKVKKFDTQQKALDYQKKITGKNFDDGYVKCKQDYTLDERKGNKIPFMISENGDLYYVYTTPKENLNLLHKLEVHTMLSDCDFNIVKLKNDKIIISGQVQVPNNQPTRDLCVKKNLILTSQSYL